MPRTSNATPAPAVDATDAPAPAPDPALAANTAALAQVGAAIDAVVAQNPKLAPDAPEGPPPASAFPFATILVRAKGAGEAPHVNEHGRDSRRRRPVGRDDAGRPSPERVPDHHYYRRLIKREALELVDEGGQ